MTRPPGRPKGTHPPPRFTVLVSFRVEPVTAAALDCVRQGSESRGAAARRILVETLAAMEVERLRAELAELRLFLAAEQGKPEGAPSAGWEPDRDGWVKAATELGLIIVEPAPGGGHVEWHADRHLGGFAPTMRAAMQAADAAEAQAAAKEPTP